MINNVYFKILLLYLFACIIGSVVILDQFDFTHQLIVLILDSFIYMLLILPMMILIKFVNLNKRVIYGLGFISVMGYPVLIFDFTSMDTLFFDVSNSLLFFHFLKMFCIGYSVIVFGYEYSLKLKNIKINSTV
jgi:hypothetical protein